MQYAYLVVEGPHDLEFVGRLLKPHGLQRIKNLSQFDPLWRSLVPRKFPVDDEDLLKRVPVPVFFASAAHSIAVHSASGDTRLFQTVQETLSVLPGGAQALTGLAILLDADSDKIPAARFSAIRTLLLSLSLALPDQPGEIGGGSPRTGIYVLPDNRSAGTLEDLLIEAGDHIYPGLMAGARQYINSIDPLP